MNNILWPLPQVRKQLGRSGGRKPDDVAANNVPPGQMVSTITDRFGALEAEVYNQTGAGE